MTKQHILDISTKEFATYGYNGLSMNNLAKKLEINKATIYYHFKDKQSLYHAVMLDLFRLKRDELVKLVNNTTITGKDKFYKYIELLIHILLQKTEMIPLTLREMANFGQDIQNGVEEELDIETEYLISILNELPLKEKYIDIDPTLIKAIIFGTICTYFVMNMAPLECKYKRDYKQNPEEIFKYLNEHLGDFILETICKD